MRTTVTLDPDTEALVRRSMRQRGISFKQAINDAIRAGSAAVPAQPRFQTATASMGQPSISLDRALQLAADLEDAEALRKAMTGR